MSEPHSAGHGYEEQDLQARPVLWAGLGIVALLLLAMVSMWGLWGLYSPAAKTTAKVERVPPEPRLQTAPVRDLEELHAWEASRLTGYAWVDRQSGTLRIPIERAIDLVAGEASKR